MYYPKKELHRSLQVGTLVHAMMGSAVTWLAGKVRRTLASGPSETTQGPSTMQHTSYRTGIPVHRVDVQV